MKAQELFMQEQMRSFDLPNQPERCELLEGGYFDQAKLIVLREVQARGTCNVAV